MGAEMTDEERKEKFLKDVNDAYKLMIETLAAYKVKPIIAINALSLGLAAIAGERGMPRDEYMDRCGHAWDYWEKEEGGGGGEDERVPLNMPRRVLRNRSAPGRRR